MENKIQLHDTVIVKNIDWCGNGTAEYPLHKCNAVGEVTSIRELSLGHSNKHTYEVTWRGGVIILII